MTAPAVPLPTDFTAAACALVAASPVTAFSASSWAAVPWAGPLKAGGACLLEALVLGACPELVLVDELAAPAIAEPPRARAASAATPGHHSLGLSEHRVGPFVVRVVPGVSSTVTRPR